MYKHTTVTIILPNFFLIMKCIRLLAIKWHYTLYFSYLVMILYAHFCILCSASVTHVFNYCILCFCSLFGKLNVHTDEFDIHTNKFSQMSFKTITLTTQSGEGREGNLFCPLWVNFCGGVQNSCHRFSHIQTYYDYTRMVVKGGFSHVTWCQSCILKSFSCVA